MLHARPDLTRRLQLSLLEQGIPLYWYDDVPLTHPAFAATQLLAVEGVWEGEDDALHFSPEKPMVIGEGKRRVGAAARSIVKWAGPGAADGDADVLRPEHEDMTLPLRREAAITLVTLAIRGAASRPSPVSKWWAVRPPYRRHGEHTVTRGELAAWLGELVRAAIVA